MNPTTCTAMYMYTYDAGNDCGNYANKNTSRPDDIL